MGTILISPGYVNSWALILSCIGEPSYLYAHLKIGHLSRKLAQVLRYS